MLMPRVSWLAAFASLLVGFSFFAQDATAQNATGQNATGQNATDPDSSDRPHIVFVMADDMGWGQTGYRGHPILKTPNLDAMASHGLRFDRFYAGAPVCSPTRATVMTGRANDRTGVLSHGYALRQQEKTIAQALRDAGYVTGHFGKWHLNGMRGPGVPMFQDDEYHPGRFGFDDWVSVTNFYDMDPLMSRAGEFQEFEGDSSEIAVDEAIRFLRDHRDGEKPMFAVVWYGTPHSPFKAYEKDKQGFEELDEDSANHYGELVAMDRSIGTLRKALREMEIADDTLLVFCSDNGGLPRITPDTVGGLRGKKGSIFEGGLRVPAVIEWPSRIDTPRVTDYPASTLDLFPTVADLLGLPESVFVQPIDGISLRPLFDGPIAKRDRPIPFRFGRRAAWVDNRYKLLTNNLDDGSFELYDLANDPHETKDLSDSSPQRAAKMKQALLAWNESVEASFAGKDYPAGELQPADPEPAFWFDLPQYEDFVGKYRDRWEFKSYIDRQERRRRDAN